MRTDAATEVASDAFEYRFDGTSQPFIEPTLPPLPPRWRLGLLLGPSGSGKSTVLNRLSQQAAGAVCHGVSLGAEGDCPPPLPSGALVWPIDRPALQSVPGGIAALRPYGSQAVASASRLPFHRLSRGERTVLALARLCADTDVAVENDAPSLAIVDEFTSFVDRPCAAAVAAATHTAWLRRSKPLDQLVCASVHEDILSELKPDWSFDTGERVLTVYSWAAEDIAHGATTASATHAVAVVAGAGDEGGGAGSGDRAGCSGGSIATTSGDSSSGWLFEAPRVEIVVRQTMRQPSEEAQKLTGKWAQEDHESAVHKRKMWDKFKEHHYMDSAMNTAATCAVARWGRTPVGFVAVLPQPGIIKEGESRICYREHRLVILPEFQGLGIGSRLSDATGERFLRKGRRYCSRTAHITLREHRLRSPSWSVCSASEEAGASAYLNCRQDRAKGGPSQLAKINREAKPEGKSCRVLYTFEYHGNTAEQEASFLASGVKADDVPLLVKRAAATRADAEATARKEETKIKAQVKAAAAAKRAGVDAPGQAMQESRAANGKRPAEAPPLGDDQPATKRGRPKKQQPPPGKSIASFFGGGGL